MVGGDEIEDEVGVYYLGLRRVYNHVPAAQLVQGLRTLLCGFRGAYRLGCKVLRVIVLHEVRIVQLVCGSSRGRGGHVFHGSRILRVVEDEEQEGQPVAEYF